MSSIHAHPNLQPPAAEGMVQRTELVSDLLRDAAGRTTFVQAPAGYGKTVLLAQCYQHLLRQGQPVAWLTLAEDDRQPRHFVTRLSAALVSAGFRSVEFDAETITIEPDALRSDAPRHIIIDDVDLLDQSPSLAILRSMVLSGKEAGSLILSGRNPLGFDLSKERLAQTVRDVGAAKLRFSQKEAEELAQGCDDPEFAASVHEICRGWPIITALLLRKGHLEIGKPAPVTLAKLGGAELGRYFEHHVLHGLPRELRRALELMALLERFSGAAISAIDPEIDGWGAMEEMVDRCLPIESLDPLGDWYALHPLLAAYIQLRLGRSQSGSLQEIQTRAARWFCAERLYDLALTHAVQARDADIIEEVITGAGGWRIAVPGNHEGIAAALALVSPERVAASEALSLTHVYLLAHREQIVQARRVFDEYERTASDGEGTLDRRIIGHLLDCFEEQAYSEEAIAGISATINASSPSDAPAQIMLEAIKCFILPELGLVSAALDAGDRGIAYARNHNYTTAEVHFHYHEGSACVTAGRLRDALAFFSAGLEHARSCAGYDSELALHGRALLAETALLRNDRGQAGELLGQLQDGGSDFVFQYPNYFPFRAAYLTAATLALSEEGIEEAYRIVRQCIELARRRNLPQLLLDAVSHWAGRLLLLGKIDEAATALDSIEKETAHLLGGNTRAEIACRLTSARIRLAEGRTNEALCALDEISVQIGRRQLGCIQVEHMVLHALAFHQLNRTHEAIVHLNRALQAAVFEQLRSPFVRQGEALADILDERSASLGKYGTNRVVDTFARELATECQREERQARESVGGVVLSKREGELLELLCRGLANKEIARKSGMSDKTVKWHLRNVYSKIGVNSRREAISKVQRHRLQL